MQLVVLALLRALFLLMRPVPRWSGHVAYRLFSSPTKGKPLSNRARALIERAETVTLEHQGHALVGYRWRPPGDLGNPGDPGDPGDAPTVLLVHGWSSRALRFRRWVEPLLDAGFTVVAFDGPGHGASPGRRLTMAGYVRMLSAVATWIGTPYALIGHSFGASASSGLAVGSHLTGLPSTGVERLVLIAAPNAADDVFDRFGAFMHLSDAQLRQVKNLAARDFSAGHTLSAWTVATMLHARPIPTLVAHARDDPEVPFADGAAIARAAGVALKAVDELGHHRIIGDRAVIDRAVAFLRADLTNDSVA